MLPLPLLCAPHTLGSPPAASCLPTTALHFTRNLGCLLWQASSILGDLGCERLTVCRRPVAHTRCVPTRVKRCSMCTTFSRNQRCFCTFLHAGKRRLEAPQGELENRYGKISQCARRLWDIKRVKVHLTGVKCATAESIAPYFFSPFPSLIQKTL